MRSALSMAVAPEGPALSSPAPWPRLLRGTEPYKAAGQNEYVRVLQGGHAARLPLSCILRSRPTTNKPLALTCLFPLKVETKGARYEQNPGPCCRRRCCVWFVCGCIRCRCPTCRRILQVLRTRSSV